MDVEQQLYEFIEKNDTQNAMAILQLPSLKLRSSYGDNCQTHGDDGVGKTSTNWSMLQWGCFHGNEQVKNVFD